MNYIKIIDADYNNTGSYRTYYKEARAFTEHDGSTYWHYSYDDHKEYFFEEEPEKVLKTVYLHFD